MPTPDEIADKRFLIALRGYDRDQVHLFLAEVSQQVAELERENADLARQLDAARAHVAERGSRTEPAPAPPSQQAATPRPFAALGEETQRVLEAAQEAAEAITSKARQDADRQLQAARQATAKVIAEGERRRDQNEQAIAELEERRAEVARELSSVGLTIEQLVSALSSSEETPTVREALTDPGETGSGEPPKGIRQGKKHTPRRGNAVTREHQRSTSPAAQPPPPPGDQGLPASEAGVAASGAAEPPEVDTADAEPVEEQRPSAEDSGGEPAVAADEPDAAEPGPAESGPAEAGPAEPGPAEPEPVEEGPAEPEPAEAGPAEPEPAEPEPAEPTATEPATEAPALLAVDTGTVDTLDVVEAGALVAAGGGSVSEAPPDSGPAALSDHGASALSLRAGALEPLHPKMMRRLKRRISDLQNVVLDRLRRSSGRGDAESLVPGDEELAVLAEVGEEFLDQAYGAGVDAAAVLAGRSLSSPNRYRALDGDFADDGGERIRESVLVSLRVGFAGEEPLSVLNDRVGTVFSELKSTAADELSAIHLIRAYEYGLLDAWDAGGVRHRVWIPGRELRCPEGRCRQNDETGAVEVSQSFPSGHEVPPVHAGCTCTTIPALEP